MEKECITVTTKKLVNLLTGKRMSYKDHKVWMKLARREAKENKKDAGRQKGE
jgi:hypothetical protein